MSRTIDLPGAARLRIAAGTALGIALLLGLGSCAEHAARRPRPEDALPPWPHPAGWKTETLPFPLAFAPAIHHQGSEELRFAPGFFDPAAPGYFSYAFVWWLKDERPLTAATLATELNQYYAGLCTAVGKKKFALDPARYRAKLTAQTATMPGWETFTGEAELYDAFTTGLPLSLHLRAFQRACPASGHQAVLVLASPQPESAPIWNELRARAESFSCQ